MRTIPMPNITTADQLLAWRDPPWRHELWAGELRRMSPAGYWHGVVGSRVFVRLATFVREHRLGEVLATDAGFLLSREPDTVLAPDIAFVQRDRCPAGRWKKFFDGAPDLAIEVLSPRDSRRAAITKANRYLAAGSAAVWVIDSRSECITILRRRLPAQTLRPPATVLGTDLLVGFELPLTDLFAHD
jgi:Uma2 family endonuclease